MPTYVEQIGEAGDCVVLAITPDGFRRVQELANGADDGLTEIDRMLLDLLLQRLSLSEMRTGVLGAWLDRGIERDKIRVRPRYMKRLAHDLETAERERVASLIERESGRE